MAGDAPHAKGALLPRQMLPFQGPIPPSTWPQTRNSRGGLAAPTLLRQSNPVPRVAIIGTVGLPARYGGFETLAEALVSAAQTRGLSDQIAVYCSAPQSPKDRPTQYKGAPLRYLPLRANGVQSIPYDAFSMISAIRAGAEALLILVVSGAVALPFLRRATNTRLVVNPDGMEWRRDKWRGPAKRFLKASEKWAMRHAHAVIADNSAIAEHISENYGITAHQITYGGDRARPIRPADISDLNLPPRYALATARAEPENNLALILQAFAALPQYPLVVLSNWSDTAHGRWLKARFGRQANLHLVDANYEPDRLYAIRQRAEMFLHGHSAGGTNPVLVEMMHTGLPIAAFDCVFNRITTENRALYFDSIDTLRRLVPGLAYARPTLGTALAEVASRRYRWGDVADAYFDLLGL